MNGMTRVEPGGSTPPGTTMTTRTTPSLARPGGTAATLRPITSTLHERQVVLLRAVLARLDGRPAELPPWSLDEVRLTGLATGLTALAGQLGLFDGASPAVVDYISEQRLQVRRRVARFDDVLPVVVTALDAAAIPAVVVKGGALLQGVWDERWTRPMADIDLIVPATHRAQAAASLTCAGLRPLHSTAFEDAFLAWGDGSVGRIDGESAEHNGRVELHPGWLEFLHGYTVRGFALDETAFDHIALTAHVLGHLASTVVRAEVRAVNVVDVWWCSRHPIDWERMAVLLADTDPRLTAPALWLVDHLVDGAVPATVVDREWSRLPRAARRTLASASPADVLRDPVERTSLRWRQSFARTPRERMAIVDAMAWPDGRRTLRGTRRGA